MSFFGETTKWVLIASVAVWFILLGIYAARRNGLCKKLEISWTLLISGALLISTWCLRYAVGYYSLIHKLGENGKNLTWGETIASSFIHALQTFSMDEDYDKYILYGRDMMVAAFGEGTWLEWGYSIYASLLNVAAPIAGGAIVLKVLAQIFPEIRLWLSFFQKSRKKYYFSELNATSLALAKSIWKQKNKERPLLVFTDTYVDDENEKEYELLLEAKRYGAICIRKDLSHVIKPWCGQREFYLMDENEFSNLQSLMGLMEDRNIRYLRDSSIYLFVQTDAYVQIEKQAKQQLEDKKALLKGRNKPIIIPVRGYRNLVQNLFNTVPLYEPLVNRDDQSCLNVTILGNGIIGTEAFLSAYWLGQLMTSKKDDTAAMEQCELTLHVISKDTEEQFWSRIDYVNPEIRKTAELLDSTLPKGPEEETTVLKVFPDKEECSKPYCRVRYTQRDLKSGGFWTDADRGTGHLLESDYYIVALGSDSDNIAIAEKLRSFIGKRHMEKSAKQGDDNVVIAYAVFDSELSAALNREKHFTTYGRKKPDIYMRAFGNLDEVYSIDNVQMSKNLLWAVETGNAYLHGQYENSHRQDNLDRGTQSNYENANYNYWASLARAMHMKYKLFSLGWIETTVFRHENEEQCKEHWEKMQKLCATYQLLAAANSIKLDPEKADSPRLDEMLVLSKENQKKLSDLKAKKEYLAWLEHRRWNAFTRVMGYVHVDIERIMEASGADLQHKDMRLKLHSCLVEARLPDEKYPTYVCKNGAPRDMLDAATEIRQARYVAKRKDVPQDFKKHDYYVCEFDNFKLASRLVAELAAAHIENPEQYCDYTKFQDSITCKTSAGELHLVTLESVKWLLGRDFWEVSKEDHYRGSFVFQKTCYAPKKSVTKDLRKPAEEIAAEEEAEKAKQEKCEEATAELQK